MLKSENKAGLELKIFLGLGRSFQKEAGVELDYSAKAVDDNSSHITLLLLCLLSYELIIN